MSEKSWNSGKGITLAVVIVAVVVVLLFGAGYFSVVKSRLGAPGAFQAIFLTNGQVYFGKIDDVNDSFVKLTNIYYLQLKQPLQNQDQTALNQPDLSLIKLGDELHGPADLMAINRDHILFIETLKPDSKVLQAIEKYKVNK